MEDQALTDARNEALRRIGRNVVLFQQLENVLKFLASIQHPSTPVSRVEEMRAVRAEAIRVKTRGQVASMVVEDLFVGGSDAKFSGPAETAEPWVGFSFRIARDADEIAQNYKTLKALIEERNDLIHHLLARWNLDDAERCRALSAELDDQRLRIIHEIERYRAYVNAMREMGKALQAFMDSEEGKRHLDVIFLQGSRLAALLTQVATTHARPDGWTLLSVAGNELNALIPEQFAKLKREHGEGSLRKLVETIDLFDVQSEETANGGTRVIYRARQPAPNH